MSNLEIQPLITNGRSASETSVSGRGGMQTPTAPAAQPKIDTVWKACAYGDFETLRSLLGQDPSLVQRGDEQVRDCLRAQLCMLASVLDLLEAM